MMKYLFFIFMMILMVSKNSFMMFYYNLLGLMMIMFMFMFKLEGVLVSNMYLMIDYYSNLMIMLMLWIISLIIMGLESGNKNQMKLFYIMVMILFLFFISNNMYMFFFFFELSLIPIYVIIIYWGYNIERMKASYYLLMYTMLISLPFLIYVMLLYVEFKSVDFQMLIMFKLEGSLWSLFIMLGSFLVKLPMFMFHSWLPKAHVEASVYGSMILAAVLLKMGGYGLMRLMIIFLINSVGIMNKVISVSIVGALMISVICLVQIDMKSMVAYSSVVHMNVMLCSLMSVMKVGFVGCYVVMVSHGLCSSGLFYMSNLCYKKSLSRLLMINKGVLNLFNMKLWWFLMCVSNFSFPFSMGFMSEIYLMSVLISLDKSLIVYLIMIMFFSSAYSLYLYSLVGHGEMMNLIKISMMVKFKELVIIILHLWPLMFMLINMSLF